MEYSSAPSLTWTSLSPPTLFLKIYRKHLFALSLTLVLSDILLISIKRMPLRSWIWHNKKTLVIIMMHCFGETYPETLPTQEKTLQLIQGDSSTLIVIVVALNKNEMFLLDIDPLYIFNADAGEHISRD